MESWQNVVTDFSLYLTVEKGLSKNSIQAYLRDLAFYLKGVAPLEEEVRFELLSEESCIRHLSSRRKEGLASTTLFRLFVSLRLFFRFLRREGCIDRNPMEQMSSPKMAHLLPAVLSIEEVESLLQQPDPDSFVGARDAAILELLYSSGLRVSELLDLRIHDLGEESLRILGKGNRERLIPVGRKARKAVEHYLLSHHRRHAIVGSTLLFFSQKGNKLSRVAVWKQVKRYAARVGITKVISPHTFRHTFATHLLDAGADLRVIQELLGHASIGSTDLYTHLTQTKIQRDFQKFHRRFS